MPEDPLHDYLHRKVYTDTMTADMQTIPARHGTATFVPAGSTIKIVNTSGTQIVDTWAFALPTPPKSKEEAQSNGQPEETPAETKQEPPEPAPKRTKSKKGDMGLPSQEEAEAATSKGMDASNDPAQQKKGWSSYLPSVPSIPLRAAKSDGEKAAVKQNSRTWGQYFSAGQGISNYIPNKNSFSSFAKSHYRDPNKPIIQQISDFSRTPVGAAGVSALSGQGYASSLYAGYSAWAGGGAEVPPGMEFLSLPHSRAATLHLVPKVGDTLVSNLREPMLTVVEDTAATHDTLIAACDPARYEQLGVEGWEEHGSCAENLVLALKELNERAGLKGPKGIGADVTVNSVPAPLNLFMNIPWTNNGDVKFDNPKGKKGEYVRFKAERDVVVVMSACPQDVIGINGGKQIQDGHFVVEEELEEGEDIRQRLQQTNNTSASAPAAKKPTPVKRATPAKKPNGTAPAPAKKAPAASASKPAASGGHTPIGSTKKARTPIGTKKAIPSSSSSSTPAASGPSAPSRPTPPAAASRKDSASTIPSNTKHAGGASTVASSSPAQSTKAPSAGGSAAGGAPAPAQGTAAAERKKPRKLVRK
ncbi:hypothetical protein KVT40_004130 [Elsinoe batatas]|uniref:DUF1989 domain-containing protein n=1 Tax=Elsinoe batatas TaxID=2601811 RepID=A0A8K0L3D7_9PEZI|nr:hypothetical protein KVT40_004130 [Elsinoe batatas]